MKKLLVLSLFSIAAGLTAQKKEYDPKVMGCYKGSEVNQQMEGVSKYWVSCRLEKGKSILMFVAINADGSVVQETENGSWWTQNGKYYELHKTDNVTDIYNYEVLANGDVKFQSVEMMGKKDNTYVFTDTKINED
ncbi:hypothetical protein EGY05_04320 [Chryseobacterium arthrosphaerae]|uniref:Uncharacterized protein n=1 Tax=Chryseobacterium arthrosphaerae TaxID=651561 RepID=A0A1B8ZN75_9FLAO|nr:hypothetical protein [Chryseobacterium arthrosphaerae]AYZ11195.1 hypothetical protein EGY05_04320 [Chryseobacterium arthrosphaerae]MDG4653201.1 hypothetical protein [Chryseobacterium arthrosphaerae]OCA73051.1 hypothetical protein BBI00_01275 [Chryseobacterium arthrosphaerae]QUY56642.1 hypothetical protein I2F65_04700 [Chryseobacterium arthrosphaerae]UEQ76508.1 hypothetical protein J8N07_23360 [Chryseobacterium arthrosphaerae]